MALETLKDVTEIGGFKIVDMNAIKETNPEMFRPDGSMIYHLFDEKIRPFNFIYIRHDVNSLSFNLQNGPIKVDEALLWLQKRKADREKRQVEGLSKP